MSRPLSASCRGLKEYSHSPFILQYLSGGERGERLTDFSGPSPHVAFSTDLSVVAPVAAEVAVAKQRSSPARAASMRSLKYLPPKDEVRWPNLRKGLADEE